MEFFSASFWLQLTGIVGVPGVFALMLWIFLSHNERRQKELDKLRTADSLEHVKKWDSMVDQHRAEREDDSEQRKEERGRAKEELERMMRLLERQAVTQELQASLLIRINDNVTSNQFCPAIRKKD
jgi:hypothetical protein